MKNLHELDQYRVDMRDWFGSLGDGGCGAFKIHIGGRSFFAVASNGGGWEHVSVSPCNRKRKACPTWEEMCAVKDLFFEPEECVVQYHPPRSEYVNMHPCCLHLWRPLEAGLPRPPAAFV